MNEALHFIRKAIITRLSGSVTLNSSSVPVYNRVPSNATFPFIRVYSFRNDEIDQNRDSFITDCQSRIEVVTSFESDNGGEYDSNLITNQILSLIRTRSSGYFDLSKDDFKVITCTNEGVVYFEEDSEDKTYFRTVINISNRVQQYPLIEVIESRSSFFENRDCLSAIINNLKNG